MCRQKTKFQEAFLSRTIQVWVMSKPVCNAFQEVGPLWIVKVPTKEGFAARDHTVVDRGLEIPNANEPSTDE